MIKAPCDKYNKAIPAVNNLYKKKQSYTPLHQKKITSITLTPHEAMNFQSECTDCLAIRTWTKNLVQQCCTAKTTWLKWPRVQVTAVNFRTHVVWLEEIQNTIIYHLSTSSQPSRFKEIADTLVCKPTCTSSHSSICGYYLVSLHQERAHTEFFFTKCSEHIASHWKQWNWDVMRGIVDKSGKLSLHCPVVHVWWFNCNAKGVEIANWCLLA